MLGMPFDDIDEAALAGLIANEIPESRDLEFKRDLPGQDPDNIREFLADVTSLANTNGGDLIFGIEDVEGVAAGFPASPFPISIMKSCGSSRSSAPMSIRD